MDAVFFFLLPPLTAGDLASPAKFTLTRAPRSNCFRTQLRFALALLPGLLVSPLAAQNNRAPPSSS